MDKWGYLGSACLPAAFDDAIEDNPLSSGDLVVFCATGGGLAMGCTAWRWGAPAKSNDTGDRTGRGTELAR